MKKIISALALIALSGCASYQSSFEVAGNKFKLPKDAVFSYMEVKIPTTNGPISLVVSNGSFKMNPAVIDAKTAHDIAIINSTASAVGQVAGQAAGAMAKP